jgi:protein phosphatase
MKILILSDIHANLEALTAIRESFDELWVLGDLVNYGPDPCAAVDFVRARASLAVRGNHDHALATGAGPRCSPAFRDMARAMQEFTQSVLTEDRKDFLRALPTTARREIDGRSFFLCHAAPSDPLFKYAPQDPAFWRAELDLADADVLLTGHTHLPFVLEIGSRLVVNPGSAGQPKHGAPEACYAVWENGAVSLRSTPYPAEITARKIAALPIPPPIAAALASVLLHGRLPA